MMPGKNPKLLYNVTSVAEAFNRIMATCLTVWEDSTLAII
jgi:hypothetical protein